MGSAKHLAAAALLLLWFGTPAVAATDLRLIEAVKAGDRAAIAALLKSKIDIDAPDGQHATALHWAVHKDAVETAELLMRSGARADSATDYGVTPLWLACENRNAVLVEKLLGARANPASTLTTGETVLMTCARTGNPDAVKALLAAGANVNASERLYNQTALMWAVAQRHAAVVKVLLDHGADPHVRTKVRRTFVANGVRGVLRGTNVGVDYDSGGFSPLLFAARHGDVQSARLLLQAGAKVNDTAADGASALVLASLSGHTDFGKFLLEHGANPNADGAGYTALHAAILRGDNELVKALVARGANPNTALVKGTPVPRLSYEWFLSATLQGVTPYLLAATFAEAEIMRTLAAAGADLKATIKGGTTALMAAAGVGTSRDRRMRILTDETLTEDEEQRTLHAVEAAVALGADIDAANAAGDTALHGAATKGYQTVVDFLAARGGKLNVRNKAGHTPLELLQRSRTATSGQP